LIAEMFSKDEDNRTLWLQSGNIALNNDEPVVALNCLALGANLG
jgi:hypothetical protein